MQGEAFHRLMASIDKHGLANPLITVSDLPPLEASDWRQWRYRFLYTIAAPCKLVVGHNRYAAILALGWTHVPIIHCGPLPEIAAGESWQKLNGIPAAQRLCRDGTLGLGPFSLVMDTYTPPLKAVPAGFEG